MKISIDRYALGGQVKLSYTEAIERTKEALKTEGFGVLCEIDVAATLKTKLGVEHEPYMILGACNPALAHQALAAEPDLGLLLPCNLVVYQQAGTVWVKAIEPHTMLSVVENPAVEAIATQVREKLERVLAAIDAA
jgi:uncharacterized protein (DUF302 family)